MAAMALSNFFLASPKVMPFLHASSKASTVRRLVALVDRAGRRRPLSHLRRASATAITIRNKDMLPCISMGGANPRNNFASHFL